MRAVCGYEVHSDTPTHGDRYGDLLLTLSGAKKRFTHVMQHAARIGDVVTLSSIDCEGRIVKVIESEEKTA